jgi:chromosome segregation ATPase
VQDQLTERQGQLQQVLTTLADRSRALSVTSTQLERTEEQLDGLRQEVASLTDQQQSIEAQIATRAEIAERITEVRGRLSGLLGGDLAQLKAASEGALAEADAIQRSLEALKGAGDPAAAQQTGAGQEVTN